MDHLAKEVATTPECAALESLEDALCVLQFQMGDRDALVPLVERYQIRLLGYLQTHLRSQADALDVHQEVWIIAFRGLSGLRDPKSFRFWIFAIARKRAAKWLRRKIREEIRLGDFANLIVEGGDELDRSDEDCLRAAMNRLSDGERQVILLHYFSGLSVDEIGETIGCRPGTVKSRLFSARQKLERILERYKHEGNYRQGTTGRCPAS